MAIRAIAYHKSVAVERVEKFFDGESSYLAGSTTAKCDRCGTVFAIVLPFRDHPENGRYLEELKQFISEDCSHGLHQDEYILDRMD